ncbi:MAG: hypothetical protein D3920_14390 [Candidatus Electrothrix sp. AW2]|nr:hypothetical protein [Candidatus Electrothrix gigas]
MKKKKEVQKESGFVLVAALLILLVLTLMGIAVNRSTMTEWRIAMNDRLHKETFYAADGGTELAQEILEQNIACLIFTPDSSLPGNRIALQGNGFNILVNDALELWRNFGSAALPSDGDHDLCFPFNGTDCLGGSRTNINIAGNTKLTSGAAIQMAAGYEGRGKALASGGSRLLYDINTQRVGRDNSESMICVNYEHVLGSEGDCYY